jgi:hypothetical protein
MSDITTTDRIQPAPSLVPADRPILSDDECVQQLARAVAIQDAKQLDEVARLIGRLAVTIE